VKHEKGKAELKMADLLGSLAGGRAGKGSPPRRGGHVRTRLRSETSSEHVLWNLFLIMDPFRIPIEIVQIFPKFLLCFLGKTK